MTRNDPPIEYCALQYAEFWFRVERGLRERIGSEQKDRRLEGLAKGAVYFRVARTLRRAGDVDMGLVRFAPVFDIIDRSTDELRRGASMIDIVSRVRDQLGEVYGGKPLSATTKFMWLLHRDPFVIYDSQARARLGTREGDYGTFVASWEQHYESIADAIQRACEALPGLRPYLSSGNMLTDDEIADTVRQEWFRRRVHDVFLWEAGSADSP